MLQLTETPLFRGMTEAEICGRGPVSPPENGATPGASVS